MIDSLVRLLSAAEQSSVLTDLSLHPGNYGLVTLHRPSNVDEPTTLASIMHALLEISRELNLIFPLHPRTRQRIDVSQLNSPGFHMHLIDPLSYVDFLALQQFAKLVITDSGGVQEETTYLGVPCITLQDNT